MERAATLMRYTFDSMGQLARHLHVVDNGESAMAFLGRQGEYADAPRPDLIFLDLNLPRLDGREVLGLIKADPVLRSLCASRRPIFVGVSRRV